MALHPLIIKLWNEKKITQSINLIDKAIKNIIIFFSFFSLAILIFEKELYSLIQFIIPINNNENSNLLFPLFLTGIIWQLSFFTHKLIELIQKTHLMIFFISISILINITGNYLFLPKYGIVATAYVSLCSAFTYCLLSFMYYKMKKKLYI